MKLSFALIGTALLAAGNLVAGPDVIIKQRAKELSNQNNVRQGVAPPTQPTQPAASQTASAPPANPQQQQALTRLKADLAAIKANSQITSEQKQKIANDLIAATIGAAKPSTASAAILAEDLAAAFAEKPLSSASRDRLVLELDAVLNPSKYPQAKMDAIFTDIQAIFQENGAARKNSVKISEEVKVLAAEVKR
jgi:hypothetical protein